MGPSLDSWDFSPLISLWINRFYVYLGFAFAISLWICFQIAIRKQLFIFKDKNSQKKSVPKATRDLMTNGYISHQKKEVFVSGVKIFYGSQTGTAKKFAAVLAEAVTSLDLPVAIINLKDYDPDDNLVEEVTSKSVCAFLVATYTDGRPTESTEWFCKWLEEASSDFRFGKTYLKGMKYAVFGLGNSVYVGHFNKVGKNVDKWLWTLGAHRVMTRGEGDCNVVNSKHGSIEADFRAWKTKFVFQLQVLLKGEKKSCDGNCKKGKCESHQHGSEEVEPGSHTQDGLRQRDTEEEEPCESSSGEESGTEDHQSLTSIVDVEDLGKIMSHVKKEKREKEQQEEKTGLFRNTVKKEAGERRAMITPALREALTKQGYQLIGSHSGVKLCRWTKVPLLSSSTCLFSAQKPDVSGHVTVIQNESLSPPRPCMIWSSCFSSTTVAFLLFHGHTTKPKVLPNFLVSVYSLPSLFKEPLSERLSLTTSCEITFPLIPLNTAWNFYIILTTT
ncbi:hypothetical protein HJG60_009875 [Phyllostomus discolor]|uniref:Flavodoxin-like domain-containing protein n=1 Tax=Phyllostomus discolor TaxID=89673 RepID=A0A834B8X4_9CHIR|nr:hypothetical protein HJG60_009875 [Phyllostomus discolor]